MPLGLTNLHPRGIGGSDVAHRWAARWVARPEGGPRNLVESLDVVGGEGPLEGVWRLPASKSHAIRWMMMAMLSEDGLVLDGTEGLGEDAASMRRCLEQLGLQVREEEHAWVLSPPAAPIRPAALLNAGNSGTALRMLLALASHLEVPVMLDGDASLRRRGGGDLVDVVRSFGVDIREGDGHDLLPLEVRGPWNADTGEAGLRRDRSSQPFSALLLASPLLKHEVEVHLKGVERSSRHADLSRSIAELCGWAGSEGDVLRLGPWTPRPPSTVSLPGDASMAAFGMLLLRVRGGALRMERWPSDEDGLGSELLRTLAPRLGLEWEGDLLRNGTPSSSPLSIDLSNANDLIGPLAAMLALGPGGDITGAPHARHKESDRLSSTASILRAFDLEAEETDEGLRLKGGQRPRAPAGRVSTELDHRAMMTATCLAAECGASVEGPRLHRVADPGFLDRLAMLGIETREKTA